MQPEMERDDDAGAGALPDETFGAPDANEYADDAPECDGAGSVSTHLPPADEPVAVDLPPIEPVEADAPQVEAPDTSVDEPVVVDLPLIEPVEAEAAQVEAPDTSVDEPVAMDLPPIEPVEAEAAHVEASDTSAEALERAVAPSAEDQHNGERWGFVDEQGNIWRRASAVLPECSIGRMRGRDPLVALAALARRFRGLEVRATELAERVQRSPRPSRLLNEIRRLAERVRTSEALGDYDALFGRLAELEQVVLEAQRIVRQRKEELCAAADGLKDSSAWRETAEKLQIMQQEWKNLGSAGVRDDAVLWTRFRAAAGGFFERRAEDRARRAVSIQDALGRKQALCERAEALAKSGDWRAGAEALETMLTDWRAAGSAGRDQDHALWSRFGAARREFYVRRSAHFRQVRKDRDDNRRRKEALCAAAEEQVSAPDAFAAAEQLKLFQTEWRTIGAAAPEVNQALWRRFSEAGGKVFARLREERERRRVDHDVALRDAQRRKSSQLEGLTESIARDEDHLDRWRTSLGRLRGGNGVEVLRTGLLEKMADVETRLKEKKARLAELRSELEDIESKLPPSEGPRGPRRGPRRPRDDERPRRES